MSGIEIVTTTLFSTFLQVITDVFLDIKYHLYGYFNEGVDWEANIYMIGIFPAVNIVFLNYFPYKRSNWKKAIYLIGWWIFAVVFEVFYLWSGTFYYNGWKLWYSAIIYPFLYLLLVGFHMYTRYLLKK